MTVHARPLDARAERASRSGLGTRAAAGLALLVLGASFLTATMLAASIAPGYDFHAGAISELGVIEQTALLFNVLLIGVGALNVAAGYLLFRWHRRAWILALYLLAGIGAVGAGFMPLDTGTAHSLFALAGFVFFNLQAIATATLLRGPMRALSTSAGLIGLFYVVVMVIGDSGNPTIFGVIGHGGSERMIVYPVMLWTLVVGGHLLARPDR